MTINLAAPSRASRNYGLAAANCRRGRRRLTPQAVAGLFQRHPVKAEKRLPLGPLEVSPMGLGTWVRADAPRQSHMTLPTPMRLSAGQVIGRGSCPRQATAPLRWGPPSALLPPLLPSCCPPYCCSFSSIPPSLAAGLCRPGATASCSATRSPWTRSCRPCSTWPCPAG